MEEQDIKEAIKRIKAEIATYKKIIRRIEMERQHEQEMLNQAKLKNALIKAVYRDKKPKEDAIDRL